MSTRYDIARGDLPDPAPEPAAPTTDQQLDAAAAMMGVVRDPHEDEELYRYRILRAQQGWETTTGTYTVGSADADYQTMSDAIRDSSPGSTFVQTSDTVEMSPVETRTRRDRPLTPLPDQPQPTHSTVVIQGPNQAVYNGPDYIAQLGERLGVTPHTLPQSQGVYVADTTGQYYDMGEVLLRLTERLDFIRDGLDRLPESE